MRIFDGIQRRNCFGGELIRRTQVEVRAGKFKNEKTTGMDEVTRELVKGEGEMAMN